MQGREFGAGMFTYLGVVTKDVVADIWTSQDLLIIVLR